MTLNYHSNTLSEGTTKSYWAANRLSVSFMSLVLFWVIIKIQSQLGLCTKPEKKGKRFCSLSRFFMLTYHRTKKLTKKKPTVVYILWLFPPIFGRVGIFLHHHPVRSSKKRSYRNLIMHNQVAYWLDTNRRCARRCCLKTVIVWLIFLITEIS